MMDYKIYVDGVMYGKSGVRSVSIEAPLFEKFSVGNTCSAVLEMSFRPTAPVPRMAEIIPRVYDEETMGWKQLGVFYIDERTQSAGGILSVVAYDAMCRGDVEWKPDQNLVFPMSMSDAVHLIAAQMRLSVDYRTSLNSQLTVDYPANGYTMRDVLGFIAAAHGGNWIITAEGNLLLVPLFDSMPEETSNLVSEKGNAITFGGVRILV